MRVGRRRLLTSLAIAIGLFAGAFTLLCELIPTPTEELAYAATPRQVDAALASISGGGEPLAGAGFGPGPSWYAARAHTGTVRLDDLTAPAAGRATAGSDVFGSLSADAVEHDGVVFIAMTSGTAAIDVRTAATLWSNPSRRPVYALALADHRLFAAEAGEVTARDATTGGLLWTWSAGTAEVTTGVAVSGDCVCVGTDDGLFHVLSARDGRELHSIKLDRPAAGTIASADDMAFVLAGPRDAAANLPLYAIDLAGGGVAWRFDGLAGLPLVAPRRAMGLVAGDGVVCFSFEDEFYAVDAATGALRWRFRPADDGNLELWRRSFGSDPLFSGATVRDGVVFAVVANRVIGLTAAAGREVWRFQPAYYAAQPHPYFVRPVVRGNALLGALDHSTVHVVPIDPVRYAHAPAAAAPRTGVVRGSVMIGVAGAVLAAIVGVVALRRWRAATALICCVLAGVTAWAWAHSYTARQFVGQDRRTATGLHTQFVRRGIQSADGGLTIGITQEVWQVGYTPYAPPSDPAAPLAWSHEPLDRITLAAREAPARMGLLHFDATWATRPSGTALGPQSRRSVTVPHVIVCLVLLIPPLAWLLGYWRDRRRYPPGCCSSCGYDLRANSGRCPECGAEVAAIDK